MHGTNWTNARHSFNEAINFSFIYLIDVKFFAVRKCKLKHTHIFFKKFYFMLKRDNNVRVYRHIGKETKKIKSTFVELTPLTLSFPTPIWSILDINSELWRFLHLRVLMQPFWNEGKNWGLQMLGIYLPIRYKKRSQRQWNNHDYRNLTS